jgi:phage gpG-like protein
MQAHELIKNLGEVAKEKTLKNFDKIRGPALSPIYAKRKHGNKILQDEEKLRDSIKYIVVPKGR